MGTRELTGARSGAGGPAPRARGSPRRARGLAVG